MKRNNDYTYNEKMYKKWRADVLKRDGHRCKMPMCKYRGRVLQVHHIRRWADAPFLRYLVSNGITLCYKCHKKIKDKEDCWAASFYRILQHNMELKNGKSAN